MRDDGAMKKASDRAFAEMLIAVLQLFNQWGDPVAEELLRFAFLLYKVPIRVIGVRVSPLINRHECGQRNHSESEESIAPAVLKWHEENAALVYDSFAR